MTITTTQVSAEDALRAVAEGRQVQMVWTTDDGDMFFTSLNQNIHDIMKINDGFLIVDMEDEEPETAEDDEITEETPEIGEEIAESQQNSAETCENAAEPAREPRKKLDDGKITALFHAGWSAEKIADEIGASKQAVYAHLKALREEGRL